MTPHLEQRFRKGYPSVCQIVLRRLVEWKWGRVIPFAQFCAGLPYLLDFVYVSRVSPIIRVAVRLLGFGVFPAIYMRFGPICRVSAVLTIDGIRLTIDEKKTFFYYPTFRTSSLPGSLSVSVFLRRGSYASGFLFYGGSFRALAPGSLSGSGFIGQNGSFLIGGSFGAFRLLLVFLGGLGVVGLPPPCLLLPPFFILTKNLGNKKGP